VKRFDLFDLQAMFEDARSMAVVGNAPTVLDFESGAEIDARDVVVRFNGAQVSGLEEKLGSRTDILVTNLKRNRDNTPPPAETLRPRCVLAFVGARDYPNLPAFREWVGDIPLAITLPPDLFALPTRTRSRKLTTGTYGLFTLTRLLGIRELFLTGFTMYGGGPANSAKYYTGFQEDIATYHDLDVDARVVADILSRFPGHMVLTPEVEALIRRSGKTLRAVDDAAVRIARRERPARTRRAAAWLAWQLLAGGMKLRRFSEGEPLRGGEHTANYAPQPNRSR
jgi:hypothetical protein